MISLWDWVFAMAYMACFIGLGMLKIGYGLLAGKDSAYPFSLEEMERWDRRGRLAQMANAGTSHQK
jgi:hypothetical protein